MKKFLFVFLTLLMLTSCTKTPAFDVPDSAQKIIIRPRGILMLEEVYTDPAKIDKILALLNSFTFSEIPKTEKTDEFVVCGKLYVDYEIIYDDENFARKTLDIETDVYRGPNGTQYLISTENYEAFENLMNTLTPDNTPIIKYDYGNMDSYKYWSELYEELKNH